MEKWDGFFRSSLGGVEARVVKGARKEVRKDRKEDISREEIKMMLGGGGLKDKAVETDKIPAEIWKYGRTGMKEWIWKFCNRLWG